MFRRLIERLGHRRWFSAVGARALPPLDRAVYRLSGHRWLAANLAFPTLLLLHQGAKPVPLLFARDGDAYLVAATNWGRPSHPVWSNRLLAGQAASVEIGGRTCRVSARHLSPAEVETAWPRLLAVWPAFETYRRRAPRDIRVFRLSPAGDDSTP